jgi:hypothetical protein
MCWCLAKNGKRSAVPHPARRGVYVPDKVERKIPRRREVSA